jgi:hypothetical protein
MTLRQYIEDAQKQEEIAAFSYYFDGETDENTDIYDFQIEDKKLILEGDEYSLDIEGELNEQNIFEFKIGGHTIGLEIWY